VAAVGALALTLSLMPPSPWRRSFSAHDAVDAADAADAIEVVEVVEVVAVVDAVEASRRSRCDQGIEAEATRRATRGRDRNKDTLWRLTARQAGRGRGGISRSAGIGKLRELAPRLTRCCGTVSAKSFSQFAH
jgi:hypothetical protein